MPNPILHLSSSKLPGVRVTAEAPAAGHSQSPLLLSLAEAPGPALTREQER